MAIVSLTVFLILLTPTLLAILTFALAAKIIMGANAQQIAKGKPTKSRDELKCETRVLRGVMGLVVVVCLAVGVVAKIV